LKLLIKLVFSREMTSVDILSLRRRLWSTAR